MEDSTTSTEDANNLIAGEQSKASTDNVIASPGTSSTCTSTSTTNQQQQSKQNLGNGVEQESAEQVQALMQSLDLISRLASMDTVTYSRTLNMLPENRDATVTDDLRNAAVLQQRLDEMQLKWKLEDTAVPRLLDSIHCLHSACIQLEAQNEPVLQENNALRKGQSSSAHRIRKLETALRKLHKKNQRLKEKIQSKKSEKTSLIKNVRTYFRDFQKQESAEFDDQRLISQLEAHERVMMTGNRSRASSQEIMTGNRSRASSRDTTFSDVDVAAMYSSNMADDISYSNDDASYRSSFSSAASVITDDGIATLKIACQTVEEDPDMVLHYPVGAKLGIQFYRMTLSSNQGLLDGDSLHGAATSSSTPKSTASFSPMNFKLDSFLGGSGKKEESALIICGLNGFDEALQNNHRPTLGSRLTAVNGTPLEDGMALAQIRSKVKGRPFTMSFRVIPMTPKQKEMVEQASSKIASSTKDNDFVEIIIPEIAETDDASSSEAALLQAEKLRKQMKSVGKDFGKNIGTMGKKFKSLF